MNYPIERRAKSRRAVNITATVVYDEGITRVEGRILNVSEDGAKLEVNPNAPLPDNFYMLLPGHKLQPCRMVWHEDGSFGLIFEPESGS